MVSYTTKLMVPQWAISLVVLMNIFMTYLERKASSVMNKMIYKTCADDITVFGVLLNQSYSNIKFTSELETESCLSF